MLVSVRFRFASSAIYRHDIGYVETIIHTSSYEGILSPAPAYGDSFNHNHVESMTSMPPLQANPVPFVYIT